MTAVMPGGATNTYVPSTEATKNMIVDYSRNVDSFALNSYVQVVPVEKDVGLYTEMTVEEAGRILDSDLNDRVWADGEDEPSDNGNTEKFEFKPYNTRRYKYGYRIGGKAVGQASWDILAQHGRIKAQQAMTGRTVKVISVLTNTSNYPTGHYSAVSAISGNSGKWDESTSARQDIRRSLRTGKDKIRQATLGAVNLDEIVLVMSPGCAGKIAESQEIVDYIKGSPQAMSYIKGGEGPNAQYGLPEMLYGTKLVIEDAVKVTSRKGATRATSYVLGDSTPFLTSRKGALVAPANSSQEPRFSTCCLFMYEEMTVESKYDADNRVNKGRIVEDYDVRIVSAISGYAFTGAVN